MIAEATIARGMVAYGSTIQAIAYGLVDSCVRVVTGYPGFHAQEIIAAVGGSVSINERTAYSIAWGAALAGTRSAVVFKNVGLNDAADPFVNSMNLRTSAGLVVIVLDDVEVEGSQCCLDSRPYFDLAPGLWLEPMSATHAYACARQAALWSEELQVPVVIRVTNELLRSSGKFLREELVIAVPTFIRNPAGAVSHPTYVKSQLISNQRRAQKIQRFAELLFKPQPNGNYGSVAIGASGQSGGHVEHHVWTYPLPVEGLRAALKHAGQIEVSEHGSTFASEKNSSDALRKDSQDFRSIKELGSFRRAPHCNRIRSALGRGEDV